MAIIETLFATRIYRATLGTPFARGLERACRSIAAEDKAGQAWCRRNAYQGYTSYASLDDLTWRSPEFAALKKRLDRHAAAFAKSLELDLAGKPLALAGLWINVLPEGAAHTGHIHPHSVISGTVYVRMPRGASAIRFEDPRLPMMMGSPMRRGDAARDNRQFVYETPKPGTVLMWESWLRHEVPANRAKSERITVSFNYRWG